MRLQATGHRSQVIAFCCVVIFSLIAGCSPCDNNAGNKIVAQINKYKMTAGDLKYEFRNASHNEAERIKTENGRKQYLEGLIEKEVLLQEAQRQGIDREKDFMKSIENYWEQALLRILIERKSREISGMTHVYDNEIEEYYKSSGENAPFLKVKNEIRDAIKQKKEADAMDAWIDELKKNSCIKVNEEVLRSLTAQ
jgi:hypothetical protein